MVQSNMIDDAETVDLTNELTTKEKLHSETALISWLELQRFFAQGLVMCVSKELDLVEVATLFADDHASQLATLLETSSIAPVSNDQARSWYNTKLEVWSVVVAPYVLVQEPRIPPKN